MQPRRARIHRSSRFFTRSFKHATRQSVGPPNINPARPLDNDGSASYRWALTNRTGLWEKKISLEIRFQRNEKHCRCLKVVFILFSDTSVEKAQRARIKWKIGSMYIWWPIFLFQNKIFSTEIEEFFSQFGSSYPEVNWRIWYSEMNIWLVDYSIISITLVKACQIVLRLIFNFNSDFMGKRCLRYSGQEMVRTDHL